MADEYPLARFTDAQGPVYSQVLAELRQGRKVTHWMWFIFPQLAGLGRSAMAMRYGISSSQEAAAYLDHPLLGERLRECTRLVVAVQNKTIHQIFGTPDYLKFHSCMTLFAHASDDNADFEAALRKYYRGEYDELTLQRL